MMQTHVVRPVPVFIRLNGDVVQAGVVEGNLRAAVRRQAAAIRASLVGPVLHAPLDRVVARTERDQRWCGEDRSWKRHRRNKWWRIPPLKDIFWGDTIQ